MINTLSKFEPRRTVLLLVDIQPDFMPVGALPVAGADEIVEPTNGLMGAGVFNHFVATQDWHPRGHVSFASSHIGRKPFDCIELYGHEQTLWPDHCVQNTEGAKLAPGLPWERVSAIVRKGMETDCDSYSGFRNNWNSAGDRPSTGLAGYLRDREIDTVYICGLARDVCVKWTAEDSAAAGFRTIVIWDLTRPVDAASDERVHRDLASVGVGIVDAASIA